MKRIITYIILIIISITLGIIGLKNQPLYLPTNEILNKDLYMFNSNTGTYEKLKITKAGIEYKNSSFDFDNCNKYTYNSNTGIFKLDCNKAFRYIGKVNSSYVFKINDKNVFYYETQEESYNGEFQRKFGTTYENHTKKGLQEIEKISLDYNKLIQILSNEKVYIYEKNKKCTNTCYIYNKIFINNNSQNNRYYLNIESLSSENLNELNNINKPFSDLLTNETEYPLIIEISNNNITRNFEVKVNGFNFENYINFDIESEPINE